MGLNFPALGGPYLGHRPGQGRLQRKSEDEWTYHIDT
jgi:hypothetical protein